VRVSDLVSAYDAGRTSLAIWRKNPTQTTGTSIYFDLSMSPGTPGPNYYIGTPYNATVLARSTDGGFNHGPIVSPFTKTFHKFLCMTQTATAVPLPMIVMDYLMFYPFIEQTDGTVAMTATSSPTNPATLTRYTTGAGVQIMPVLTNADVGGTQFFFTYTNSDGVAGRVTSTVTANSQTVAGTLKNTSAATAAGRGPFMPLQAGDSGVRSIDSVTIIGSDIGLFCAVLVKPLLTTMIYDITAPVETDLIIDKNIAPTIVDDAFISAIVLPSGTIAGSAIIGELSTYWS
jgi:hypothetical protein